MGNSQATKSEPSARGTEGPLDLSRVNLENHAELRYWVEYFGTTGSKLHEAVSLMGNEVSRVRAYLRRFR